ncbi:hypothetical protein [Halopelagius longus]|uniref:Uncharacterized protein n=1 Tax=Halopelagius longus TaxID=1236180 RepID=A0A1H0YJF0_9EURY|nr:hypothetical protein [Halopelagius longus]RDI72518.1 hypothetical protein DWB78_12755 [Halopelagius longus]SDQ15160.1 hypothetical protein SAMN05216278_0666 [Halopelagius longus]
MQPVALAVVGLFDPGEAPLFVALCALAGLVASFAMDVAMVQQEEGFTPAYVAAAVLLRVSPEDVGFLGANVVHHAVGVLAGALYALLYLVLALLLPVGPVVGRVGVVPHVVAAVVVVLFIYSFFAHVVLPRAGRSIYEERSTAVCGQWLRSSLVFGAGFVLVAPFLTAVV